MIDFVRAARIQAIGVKKRGKPFARVAALKADAARRAGSEGEQRRFIERLKINRASIFRARAACETCRRIPPALLRSSGNHFVDIGISFEQPQPILVQ